MEKLDIRNNGKNIGKCVINPSNIRKFLVIASLGFAVLTTTGCSKKSEPVEVAVENTVDDNYVYSYEPRYDGIEYVVKAGDTLTGIVYSYEQDANKVYSYVDRIEDENDIDGVMRYGITIKLVGVPQSKLEQFGYTDDYEIVGYDKYVKDAYAWLMKEREWIVETDQNKLEVALMNDELNDLAKMYDDYLSATDEEVKSYLLDQLVEGFKSATDNFKKLTGLDFDSHHQAYPIPDEYKNNLSY